MRAVPAAVVGSSVHAATVMPDSMNADGGLGEQFQLFSDAAISGMSPNRIAPVVRRSPALVLLVDLRVCRRENARVLQTVPRLEEGREVVQMLQARFWFALVEGRSHRPTSGDLRSLKAQRI